MKNIESYEKVSWIEPHRKVWVVDGNQGHLHGAIILGTPFRVPSIDFLDDRCKKEMMKGIQSSATSTLAFDPSTFVDGGIWVIYVQWIECLRKDVIECCRLSSPIFVDDSSTIADRMRRKRRSGATEKHDTAIRTRSSNRLKAKPEENDVKWNQPRHVDSENESLYSELEENDCDQSLSDSDDSFDVTLSRIEARTYRNKSSDNDSNDVAKESVASDSINDLQIDDSKKQDQFEKSDIKVKVQIRDNDSYSSKKSYEVMSLHSNNESKNKNVTKKKTIGMKRTRTNSPYDRKKLSMAKLERRHRLLISEAKSKRTTYKKYDAIRDLIADHKIPVNFYHMDFGESDFSDNE